MEDDGYRRSGRGIVMIASFDAAGGPIDYYFRHILEPLLPDRLP
jgi:hypothetical protein